MATSKTTRMDAQGRVIIPPHIRKEMRLNAGQLVTVSLERGTIKIQPARERCALCGSAEGRFVDGPNDTRICRSCALAIASAITKKEEKE